MTERTVMTWVDTAESRGGPLARIDDPHIPERPRAFDRRLWTVPPVGQLRRTNFCARVSNSELFIVRFCFVSIMQERGYLE